MMEQMGQEMAQGMGHGGLFGIMWFWWILIILFLIFGIAAFIKYLTK